MSYVKLTARPGTWFKAGTEAYDYDCHPPTDMRRITLEEWDVCLSVGIVLTRGLRVVENPMSEGGNLGDEHWDGEGCSTDEFDAEIVEEAR